MNSACVNVFFNTFNEVIAFLADKKKKKNHPFIFKGSIFKTFKISCEDRPLREHH